MCIVTDQKNEKKKERKKKKRENKKERINKDTLTKHKFHANPHRHRSLSLSIYACNLAEGPIFVHEIKRAVPFLDCTSFYASSL